MKKGLLLLLICYAIFAIDRGAYQYGNINRGAYEQGTSGSSITYDTCFSAAGTGGTRTPASVADSSNNANHNLKFTATPSAGYGFSGWTDKHSAITFLNSSNATAACSLTISANDTVLANFTLIPVISYDNDTMYGVAVDSVWHTQTVTNTGGAVTSWSSSPALPAGLAFDGSGNITGTPTATVTKWTAYIISATNAGGTGKDTLYLAIYPQGSVYAALSLTVDTLGYLVTIVNAAHAGTITPATGSYSDSGTMQKLTFTGPAGYRLSGIAASGGAHLNSTQDSFYLSAAGTLTFSDTIIHYTMTNATTGSGTFTPTTGLQDSGAVFTIMATPANAKHVYGSWGTSGGAHVTAQTSTTTAWLTSAGTITGNFTCATPTYPTLFYPVNGDTIKGKR